VTDPSYLGSEDQEDQVQGQPGQKESGGLNLWSQIHGGIDHGPKADPGAKAQDPIWKVTKEKRGDGSSGRGLA
jgi:hypothetical protein